MKKYIIVGGVAGGATTAARLRRLDEEAEIVLIERGEEISFANCGLPYYVGGSIEERDNLLVPWLWRALPTARDDWQRTILLARNANIRASSAVLFSRSLG